jgi:hypothetical protein
MKDFFERFVRSIFAQTVKVAVKKVLKKKNEKTTPKKPELDQDSKIHPWRQCPIGEHWVVTHPLKVPVSVKNPDGFTIREGHCSLNPKRNRKIIADYIEPDEIDFIANKYFPSLSGAPKADGLDFENGNEYDNFIRGWTKYWNDIFKPSIPLDPNLVKALIGSESSFDTTPKPQNAGVAGKARGLIQLTDQAL